MKIITNMKTLFNLFIVGIFLFFTSCSASKELTAEVDSTRSALDQCQAELASAQGELSVTQQKLSDAYASSGNQTDIVNQLKAENAALKNQLSGTQAELAQTTQQMQETSDNYGVWFRVQIGAYEERHIAERLETTEQLSLEKRDDLQKITLGRFRTYSDAKELQSQLQAMGLKDAWVVSYKDGVRVPIDAVKN